ncbi:MAG: DUF2911 domain-containing protein [Lewinella sp.]|nr:DUF2911 domain-containing protein [Lewinella sp.]
MLRLVSFLFISALCMSLYAQELDLPRVSPAASTTFTVGMTDVTVRYSSPAVRGRTIWGDLVPYNQIWRAGANEATVITFNRDVLIEGQPLEAGSYSFFIIPRQDDRWVVVFNREPEQWGAYSYDERMDALRLEVAVDTLCAQEERLHYYLSDNDLDAGTLCLRWDARQLCLDFSVPVLDQIERRLAESLEASPADQAWRRYAEVADFLRAYESFLPEALTYAIASTARDDHSWNWWLRAQIEGRLGDFQSATFSAERALEVGQANTNDPFYQNTRGVIEAQLSQWRTALQQSAEGRGR